MQFLKKIPKRIQEKKITFQILIFLLFWVAFFVINIITTYLLNYKLALTELSFYSLLYSVSGVICSFVAYNIIIRLRNYIHSKTLFILLSIVVMYLTTYIWTFSDHLSFWIISGEGKFIFFPVLYLIKALKFSIILLAAVFLLLLAEKSPGNKFNLKNTQNILKDSRLDYNETLFIRERKKILNIKVNEIRLIQANDYYTNIITNGKNKPALSKNSLSKWENVLPKNQFLRIHRSSIINLDFVESIDKTDNDTYNVKINGYSGNLPISRRRTKTILDKFKV